jgi:hypothetical protein
MKKATGIFLLIMIFFPGSCTKTDSGRNNIDQTEFFIKNDRVVFERNSITKMAMFHHDLLLYHITRFPEQPLKMYNCGVGGDVKQDILNSQLYQSLF